VKAIAESIWNKIKGFIVDPIRAAQTSLNLAWQAIKSAASAAWKFIQGVIEAVVTPIKNAMTAIGDAVSSVVGWFEKLFGFDSNKEYTITTRYETIGSPPAELGITGDLNSGVLGDGSTTAALSRSNGGGAMGAVYSALDSDGFSNPFDRHWHARSMHGGSILRGATMFGWDAQGHPQIGGGEGPEAVVGVNSLNQQIREAVRQGLSGVAGAIASAVSGASQPIYVVLDTGELVGAIGPKMDDQLARYGDWKGGGRA
jgi:hypothetical protein